MRTAIGKLIGRRTLLRGVGALYAPLFLDAMVPALQAKIKTAKAHSKDCTYLTALLEAVLAALSLIGTLWTTEILLMEISFFHFHGTGRPPEKLPVQSMGPG